MTRYFFHLHNDIEVPDDEGAEFPDLDTARREALKSARELIAADVIGTGTIKLSHAIDLVDEAGLPPDFRRQYND